MRMVALAEIAAITAGQSPPGSTYNDDGRGLPFFQGKADFGEIHPTVRKWCSAPKKTAEAGDILISVRAPVGPTNVAAERCCIGRGLAAVRPDDASALPDFVHWILKYREPELVARARGSTFGAIAQKDLKSLMVPLPPLDEQRRIAGILNRAAKIERLRARARELMGEFIPALFVRMFGDPVENPMGWEIRRFGELVEEFRYGTSRKCSAEASDGQLPILRIPNVLRNVIDWSGVKFAALDDREANAIRLEDGDILLVRTNGNPEYIGRCAVFRDNRPAAYASYLIRARLRSGGLVASEYIAGTLSNVMMRRVLLSLARTTAGNYNINIASLGSLAIPVPPIERQRRYAQLVQTTRSAVAVAESGYGTTPVLSITLMSRLLDTGA